jgi:MoxR-like ATPase
MSATTPTSIPMMRALAAAIRSNTPVLLWGQPGVCKTAVISSSGQEWGFHVETVVGSIREASDFMGLPIEVDGEVKYAAPSWAHRLAGADKGLLFLDELTTAPPSVQRAMLRILQEREVGELTLPDSVALVAAANPPSIAVDGWDLAAPVANRLMHLDWVFDADAWIDGFVTDFEHMDIPTLDSMLGDATDADKAQAKASVVSFLRARPDFRLKVPSDPALAGKGWPSPRSWTNAAAVLSELDRSDTDAMTLVLTGCVGEAAAIEYIAWVVATDLYDPEEVLADPSIVDWTARPDRIFALMSALTAIARMRGDKRTWTAAVGAMTACAAAGRPDLAYPGARALLQKVPTGCSVPTATVKAFGELLQKTGKWAA